MKKLTLIICIAAVGLGYAVSWAQPKASSQPASAAAKAQSQPASQPTTAPAVAGEEKTSTQAWLTKMKQGGWTIPVQGFLSIIVVTFTLERLFNLRRKRIVPDGLAARAKALWKQGNFAQLSKEALATRSILGDILAFIVQHRDAPMQDVSVACGDIASRELRRHMGRVYPLAMVATLAPLLGLFGTVDGMIDSFDAVVLAGLGDAGVLAGGISKALITTAVGLEVAIPSLFIYHSLKNRTNGLSVQLEEQVTDLVTTWMMARGTEASHAN